MENTFLSYFDHRRHLKELLNTCAHRTKHYNHVINQTSIYIQQTPVTPYNQDDIIHKFYVIQYFQDLKLFNYEQQKKYLQAMSYLID